MKKTGYSTKQNNITQGDHLLLKRAKIDIAKSQEHIKYEKNQKKKMMVGHLVQQKTSKILI